MELIRGNRNFRNLLAGQFISELGNWFNFIAGLGIVRVVSDASPTAAGIFFVCRMLPFALVSPFAGAFVDRFSRRQVMIATDLARVGVALIEPNSRDVAVAVRLELDSNFQGRERAGIDNCRHCSAWPDGAWTRFGNRCNRNPRAGSL